MKYKVIYVTCKNIKEAGKIGDILLKEKLAACVNIFSIRSVFQWDGKVKRSKEVGMFIKTKEKLVDKVISKVKKLHSYKVPCIVSLSVDKGNKDFLEWIRKEVK